MSKASEEEWWWAFLWKFNPRLTDLSRERHLDASLQDVVGSNLHRASQLQVLHYQVGGHLREHLLDLMSLMTKKAQRIEMIKLVKRAGREAAWYRPYNLAINADKTKEMVINFKESGRDHHTDRSAAVERVSSVKFLGVHLADDLPTTKRKQGGAASRRPVCSPFLKK